MISGLRRIVVDGTFDDGSHLVVITDPISTHDGNLAKALKGSSFPIPSLNEFPPHQPALLDPLNQPGAVRLLQEDITLNVGRRTVMLSVSNTGDRPIQVLS